MPSDLKKKKIAFWCKEPAVGRWLRAPEKTTTLGSVEGFSSQPSSAS